MKFNPEGPFFEFMNTLAAFIGLNVIFLITCLPVFTIGPSLTALYTVTLQESRKEGGYIFSTYFHAFKNNFPQSAVAFLIQLALGAVLLFNIIFWGNQNTVLGNAILLVLTLLVVLLVFSFIYAFPLMARFQNSLKQTFKNAVALAVSSPKTTLPLLGIQAVFILACIAIPQAKVFMILVGFSFVAYCNSLVLTKLFSSYEASSTN